MLPGRSHRSRLSYLESAPLAYFDPPMRRITDPYGIPENYYDDHSLESFETGFTMSRPLTEEQEEERVQYVNNEEKDRRIANEKLSAMQRAKRAAEKAQRTHAPNEPKKVQAKHEKGQLYYCQLAQYEMAYGKFVPDSENAAWFAWKAARVAELVVARAAAVKVSVHDHPDTIAYFNAADTFKQDFGHGFSCDDGFDELLERMAYDVRTANALASECDGDPVKISELASEPVMLEVRNPYVEPYYPDGPNPYRRERARFDQKTAVVCLSELTACILVEYVSHKINAWSDLHAELHEREAGRGRDTPFSPWLNHGSVW
ncbi:hypothetical protein K438DRAFT_1756838 [Mycena galopus ATCC 62051]|nr:hypothetical protein K438DRAFT_1756838 [Mycena galopus ATCC 62051]